MHIYIEGIACLSHLLAFHSAHVWEGGREVGRENLYLSPVEKTHFGELRAKPSTANTQREQRQASVRNSVRTCNWSPYQPCQKKARKLSARPSTTHTRTHTHTHTHRHTRTHTHTRTHSHTQEDLCTISVTNKMMKLRIS
jgi:hypothetical protein